MSLGHIPSQTVSQPQGHPNGGHAPHRHWSPPLYAIYITAGVLLTLAIGIAGAVMAFAKEGFSGWFYVEAPVYTCAKVFLFLCLGFCAGVLLFHGILRIKDSDVNNTESVGIFEVILGNLLATTLVIFMGISPDGYGFARRLIIPSSNPQMPEGVEKLAVDNDGKTITWEMSGTPLWIVVNIDFKDRQPVARRSILLSYVPNVGRKYTYVLADNIIDNWTRIGVSYGKSDGPSEESAFYVTDLSSTPPTGTGTPAGSGSPTGTGPTVTATGGAGSSASGTAAAVPLTGTSAPGGTASAGVSTPPLPISPPAAATIPPGTIGTTLAPTGTLTIPPPPDPSDPDDPDTTM